MLCDISRMADCVTGGISIRALRMEGDGKIAIPDFWEHKISIHALRMEGDYYNL